MKRILCLDIGDKKIGVAVSDPSGQTALPLTTLQRTAFRKDCEMILNLLQEKEAGEILIGLPRDLDDREGPQAKKVRFFAEGLQKFFDEKKQGVTITFWEESFSSRDAEAILLAADVSRSKRKVSIDKLAATLILQNHLDNHDR